MSAQDHYQTARPCPTEFGDDPDRCTVCKGLGARCPVFVATHPDSQVAMSASHAVELLANEWANDHGLILCELCGEPAGEGGAVCPACQESR